MTLNKLSKFLVGLYTAGNIFLPNLANSEEDMSEVIKRNLDANRISAVHVRDEILRKSYQNFLPFDRTNVTNDGKLIILDENLISQMAKDAYPSDSTKVEEIKSILLKNKDFYVATGSNGSFRVVSGDALMGTTDEADGVKDVEINQTLALHLELIAKNTDRSSTEGYHFFYENEGLNPYNIALDGTKETMLSQLSSEIGDKIDKNSSLTDIERFIANSEIRKFIEYDLNSIEGLGFGSQADISITVSEIENGIFGWNYTGRVVNDSGEETEIEGKNLDSVFWNNSGIARPKERITDLDDILRHYGSGTRRVATASVDSNEQDSSETSKIPPTSESETRESIKDEKKGLSWVMGSEFSNMSVLPTFTTGPIFNGKINPFFGYGLDAGGLKRQSETLEPDRHGRYTMLVVNGESNVKRYVAGLNLIHEFNRNENTRKLALILGGHISREDYFFSGVSTPIRFNSDNIPIETKPEVSVGDDGTVISGGFQAGMQYGKLGVMGTYDLTRSANLMGLKEGGKRRGVNITYEIGGK